MSDEKELFSLTELSEDAGLSWRNYLSKAIRKGRDVFARFKGQGSLTIFDEVDSETMQATFKNLDMKNQLWKLPDSELEKPLLDMPPWHINSVVPPDIVQKDPKHFQFQFRGESINENDLFLFKSTDEKDKIEVKSEVEKSIRAVDNRKPQQNIFSDENFHNLVLRTIEDIHNKTKNLNWFDIRNGLKKNTEDGEVIEILDGYNNKGGKLKSIHYTHPTYTEPYKITESYFQNKLTAYRKLFLNKK